MKTYFAKNFATTGKSEREGDKIEAAWTQRFELPRFGLR